MIDILSQASHLDDDRVAKLNVPAYGCILVGLLAVCIGHLRVFAFRAVLRTDARVRTEAIRLVMPRAATKAILLFNMLTSSLIHVPS